MMRTVLARATRVCYCCVPPTEGGYTHKHAIRPTCTHKILPEHRNIVLMQSPPSLTEFNDLVTVNWAGGSGRVRQGVLEIRNNNSRYERHLDKGDPEGFASTLHAELTVLENVEATSWVQDLSTSHRWLRR
jgi:hypothetical protein